MSKTVLRSQIRLPSALVAVVFLWIGIWTLQDSLSRMVPASRVLGIVVGLVGIVAGVSVVLTYVRKRVVLSGDVMKVCWGFRTSKFFRSQLVQARYAEGDQGAVGYSIAYPIVEQTDGEEIVLSFLSQRGTGGGAARVDGYVSNLNLWLDRP